MIDHTRARILLVDDEPVNLKLLSKMLTSKGYSNLVPIVDSRKVLDSYKAEPVDLILLDLNMPHLNGYEVLNQLKALNDPMLPPIIVLTAQQGQDYRLRALTEGARDFLSKPFDEIELQARVRNLLDAHRAHRMAYDQKSVLEEMVTARTLELHDTRLEIVRKLGRAAEYRDNETGFHVLRMSKVSALLAHSLGWGDAKCELMLNASPMHDVGKIGVPDAVLLKPGKLDEVEWAVMKQHPVIGAELLSGEDDLLSLAREIALCHHEKWDGSGYPRGLAGPAIPQSARIVAVADVFDALVSTRPYKIPWSEEKAVDYLQEHSGRHFDPEVVEHFLRILPEVRAIRSAYVEPGI
jgi:putative two-component system response regulator